MEQDRLWFEEPVRSLNERDWFSGRRRRSVAPIGAGAESTRDSGAQGRDIQDSEGLAQESSPGPAATGTAGSEKKDRRARRVTQG